RAIRERSGFEHSLRYFSNPDQIRRTVFFCRTGGGNLIGWDPTDIRDERRRECGIYEWGRQETMTKLAESFSRFIDEVCLSPENLDIPGWDYDELGTRRMFDPCCDLSGRQET